MKQISTEPPKLLPVLIDKKRPYPIILVSIALPWMGVLISEPFGLHIMSLFGTAVYNQSLQAALLGQLQINANLQAAAELTATTAASAVACSCFSTISGTVGALLGFLIAAATIFLTVQPEGLMKKFAENSLLLPLFQTYIRAVFACALTLSVSLIAQFTKVGINNYVQEYFMQWLTLLLLSFTFAFLFQTIQILSDAGASLAKLREDEAQEQKKTERKRLEEQVGPVGRV